MAAFVLVRRWTITNARFGWSFEKTVRRYTMLKNKGTRAEWVRLLPEGALTGRHAPVSALWLRLQSYVQSWYEGKVADPCPQADHWSGEHPTPKAWANIERGAWKELECGTRNRVWDDPNLDVEIRWYP